MCFTTWKLQSAGSRLGQGGCYGDLCAASFLILNNITFPLFARKKSLERFMRFVMKDCYI